VASDPSLLASAAARFLDGALHALPPAALCGLAEAVGASWYRLAPGRRRIVRENLRIALGEAHDPVARERLGRSACAALVRVFAEAATADRILPARGRAPGRVHYHGPWEEMRRDSAAGRGAILVTGHLGNWEIGAWAARRRGIPLGVMARSLDSAVLDGLITRRRGGRGHVMPKMGGLRQVVGRLRRGGWVAMLADQNAGRHGIFVPFFGLEASTIPTPASLAVRLDVPLYLGVCLRRRGARAVFDVHVERLPAPPADTPREARVRTLLAALNAALERWIRAAPEQYNWAHRRWKTRPPDGRPDPARPFYARAPVRRGRHALDVESRP
jgi:KDO2-lipid IV(A) lauroyltransferase